MESNGKHVTLDGAPRRLRHRRDLLGRAGDQRPALLLPADPPGHAPDPLRLHRLRPLQQPARRPPRPADVERLRPERGARLRQDGRAGAGRGDAGERRPAPGVRGQPALEHDPRRAARPRRRSARWSPSTSTASSPRGRSGGSTPSTSGGSSWARCWRSAIIPELAGRRRAEAAPRQLDQRADPPLPPGRREGPSRGVGGALARPAPAGGVGIESARRARADGLHARLPHRPLLPRRRPAGDDPRSPTTSASSAATTTRWSWPGAGRRRWRSPSPSAPSPAPCSASSSACSGRSFMDRFGDAFGIAFAIEGIFFFTRGDLPRDLHLRLEAARRLGPLLVRGADGDHRDRRRLLRRRRQRLDEPAAGLHPRRRRQGRRHRRR